MLVGTSTHIDRNFALDVYRSLLTRIQKITSIEAKYTKSSYLWVISVIFFLILKGKTPVNNVHVTLYVINLESTGALS